MAMRLKKEHNLVALKVTLRTRSNEATINLALEITEHHDPITVWSAEFNAAQFGVSPHSGASDTILSEFQLPDGVVDPIGATLEGADYDGPLWLHLVKPYGVLGALPWEAWLSGIERSVLRIPDALAPPPDEGMPTLDVVLCASRPAGEADFNAPEYVVGMAAGIFRGVADRDVRLHVFTDQGCVHQIEAGIISADLPAQRISVRHPEQTWREPRPTRSNRPTAIANPWLSWMLDEMHGRPVDVVHFLCHGYAADGSGSLAFAHSPTTNSGLDWGRFIGGGELGRFLLGIGAWSLGFSSPPSNASEFGLRLLADEFAQMRPGPVFHHHLPLDAGLEALQATYRFLYARERSMPPPMSSVSLCCQPALLGGPQPAAMMKSANAPLQLGELLKGRNEPPSWLASTQRLLEEKAFEVSRSEVDSLRLGAPTDAGLEGFKRGLGEIEEALSRMGRKGLL